MKNLTDFRKTVETGVPGEGGTAIYGLYRYVKGMVFNQFTLG